MVKNLFVQYTLIFLNMCWGGWVAQKGVFCRFQTRGLFSGIEKQIIMLLI